MLLCALGLSARATIDMAMNTTNFVAGQASTLSVDGVITPGGTSTSITATHLTIRFDPAKLTLSTFQSASNWSLLGTNTDELSSGVFQAVLTNVSGPNGEGQTTTGPLLSFLATPANADVNPSDCSTLRLDVSPGATDMADQAFDGRIPSDPCSGQQTPGEDPPLTRGGGGPMGPSSVGTSAGKGDVNGDGVVDIRDAVLAIRIAVNPDLATPDESARADVYPVGQGFIGDAEVTLDDARSVLRIVAGMALQPDAPTTPHALRAAATGTDSSGNLKITLFWVGLPGATSYRVYRASSAGGENYSSPLATVAEAPANHSYSGSPYLCLTDAVPPESDGRWYYYTVCAVSSSGSTAPSEEAAVVATGIGVPWDSRDRSQIIPSFLRQFRLDTPTGRVRIVGPDETVYDSDYSDPLPPEGTYELATNTFTMVSGESLTLPSDPPSEEDMELDITELPPSDGPYRSVRSITGYSGSCMGVSLPSRYDMGIYADKGDIAYVYVGANGKTEIDIGLQYSPVNYNWALYALWRKGKTKEVRPLFVTHPSRIPAGNGITTTYRYYAARIPYAGGLLTVSHLVGPSTVYYTVGTYADAEPAIRMKRVVSIAQKGSANKVRSSGSRLGINNGVYYTSCSLLDSRNNSTPWDQDHTYEAGVFTGGGNATITFGGTIENESNLRIWAVRGR